MGAFGITPCLGVSIDGWFLQHHVGSGINLDPHIRHVLNSVNSLWLYSLDFYPNSHFRE